MSAVNELADALRSALGPSSEVEVSSSHLSLVLRDELDGEPFVRSQRMPLDALRAVPPDAPFAACAGAFARLVADGDAPALSTLATLLGQSSLVEEDHFVAAMTDDDWVLALEQANDPTWWEGRETPLAKAEQAAGLGNFVVLAELLANQPQLATEKSEFGFTLLHQVAERCDSYGASAWIRSLDVLIEHGADPNAQNDEGNRPLHIARADMVLPLVRAGAELDAKNLLGRTPLVLLATERDSIDAMRALLEAGADRSARDDAGHTAADYAARRGEHDKVALLER